MPDKTQPENVRQLNHLAKTGLYATLGRLVSVGLLTEAQAQAFLDDHDAAVVLGQEGPTIWVHPKRVGDGVVVADVLHGVRVV